MDEIEILRHAIKALRADLPALVGADWPKFRVQLEGYLKRLKENPELLPALRIRILALFGRHRQAHQRLVELIAEFQDEASRSVRGLEATQRKARRMVKSKSAKPTKRGAGPPRRAPSHAFVARAGKTSRSSQKQKRRGIQVGVVDLVVRHLRKAKPALHFARAGGLEATHRRAQLVPKSKSPRRTKKMAVLLRPARFRGLVVGAGKPSRSLQEQKPRWILANVFDLSAADRKKPTPAFRAGGAHEIRVIIGAEREDWLVARGRDASESIDRMLPTGTHELTVVFFIPALGIHRTGKLTLPPKGPTPQPAKFRFEVGAAGSAIEALISIVHRGRVLQTALLSGKAVADPLRASKAAKIALRLQVVVPGFADLDRRQPFDAALVAATGATDAAVAAGVVHSAAGPGRTVLFDRPRIDGTARAIRTVLEEVVTDDSTKANLDSEAARTLLWKLAQQGRLLYEDIGKRLEKELSGQDLSRLQLVQADPDAFIPIEFTYGLPTPANGAGLCRNWKGALAGKACTAQHHRTDALGHLKVVCPSGFWSVSKVIERQFLEDLTSEEMRRSDFGVRAEPNAKRQSLPPIGSALFAWSDILDNTVPGTSAGVLKSLNEVTRKHAAGVKTWRQWAKAIKENQPGLLVLLSHTVDDALEIGPENSGEKATLAQINSNFVRKLDKDAPIVFLLGCTTGVADDKLVSFVGRFRHEGAALVVGTITPVLGERSAAVVEAVVAKLAQKRARPARFGELMRDARRDLLSRGELTALCATSFGDASWLVN